MSGKTPIKLFPNSKSENRGKTMSKATKKDKKTASEKSGTKKAIEVVVPKTGEKKTIEVVKPVKKPKSARIEKCIKCGAELSTYEIRRHCPLCKEHRGDIILSAVVSEAGRFDADGKPIGDFKTKKVSEKKAKKAKKEKAPAVVEKEAAAKKATEVRKPKKGEVVVKKEVRKNGLTRFAAEVQGEKKEKTEGQ